VLSRLFYTGPSLPTLHEEYAKHSRIDEAAQRTSEGSVLIEAPVPQVWALLSDVARWPSWYPQLTVLSIGAVRPDAPLHWKLGRVAVRSTSAGAQPPARTDLDRPVPRLQRRGPASPRTRR